jgi:hypothetical protein
VLHQDLIDPASGTPFDFTRTFLLTSLSYPSDEVLKVNITFIDRNFHPIENVVVEESCLQMRTMSFAPPIISNIVSNPHPANNSFEVEYNLLQSANVEYEIRNQYGNVIFYENAGSKSVGLLNKTFDTSGLVSGQYYIVIKAGTETKVVSFVVIH